MGKTRWSPTTFKTLEGSAAFTLSIVACAWIARLLGLVEPFSVRPRALSYRFAGTKHPRTSDLGLLVNCWAVRRAGGAVGAERQLGAAAIYVEHVDAWAGLLVEDAVRCLFGGCAVRLILPMAMNHP
jgi:hypothetical protein